jgi:hypothetical protein
MRWTTKYVGLDVHQETTVASSREQRGRANDPVLGLAPGLSRFNLDCRGVVDPRPPVQGRGSGLRGQPHSKPPIALQTPMA